MRLEHGGALVAQRELDAAILPTLESAAVRQVRPNGAVFRWRHGGQHVPCVHQLFHDARHPSQGLESRSRTIGRHVFDGRAEFVQHQLHPQLAGLMLDDEQHLVVVGRQGCLRIQQSVQLQIVAVAHVPREVETGAVVLVVHG